MDNFNLADLMEVVNKLAVAQKLGHALQRRLEGQINPKSLEQEHLDWLMDQRDYLGNLDVVTMEADENIQQAETPQPETATIADTLTAWAEVLQEQRTLLSAVDAQLNILVGQDVYPAGVPFSEGHARRLQMSVQELVKSNTAEQRQTSKYKAPLSQLRARDVSETDVDDTETAEKNSTGVKGFFGRLFGK